MLWTEDIWIRDFLLMSCKKKKDFEQESAFIFILICTFCKDMCCGITFFWTVHLKWAWSVDPVDRLSYSLCKEQPLHTDCVQKKRRMKWHRFYSTDEYSGDPLLNQVNWFSAKMESCHYLKPARDGWNPKTEDYNVTYTAYAWIFEEFYKVI